MAKITYDNKEQGFVNPLEANRKYTFENANEVKASVNWLYENISFPVLGAYLDTSATESIPQEIPQDGFQTLNNNKGVVLVENLMGIDSLFDNNEIKPNKLGDVLSGYVSFIAKSTSPNASFEFGIDIGGELGVIFRSTYRTAQAQGVYRPYTIPINGYCLDTFLANGGRPVIRSNAGTLSIYNCIVQVTLLTKLFE